MLLSIEQAAVQIGKSARQVRYMVKTGKLPARRDGARWVIDSDALPRSPGQEQAAERREDRLRAAVDEALDLGGRRRRYSLRDLRAFQVGLPLLQAIAEALGPARPATRRPLSSPTPFACVSTCSAASASISRCCRTRYAPTRSPSSRR